MNAGSLQASQEENPRDRVRQRQVREDDLK